jgi:polar amino acid transport system substrate-binding protein
MDCVIHRQTWIFYPHKLFLPIQGTFTREPIGFAVRKGDVDTLHFFNNWIGYVDAEGWLKERKTYWFETKELGVADPVTGGRSKEE